MLAPISPRRSAQANWNSGTLPGVTLDKEATPAASTNEDEVQESMTLQKQEIIEMLRDNGDEGTAHQAETQLPDVVDPDKDSELLKQLGINVDYLLSRR